MPKGSGATQRESGIEDFQSIANKPLSMVPLSVANSLSDPSSVEKALFSVIDFAGQRLAHERVKFWLSPSLFGR